MLPPAPEGLRHWRLADAPALTAAWGDPTVRLWNPPPDHADAASWISRCEERWTLRLSVDFVIDVGGDVGGEVGLRNLTTDPDRAELGVWVAADHRRSGLGSTAVTRVVEWGRDHLSLQQVWCRTSRDNTAAVALFEGLGWDRLGETQGKVVWACTG